MSPSCPQSRRLSRWLTAEITVLLLLSWSDTQFRKCSAMLLRWWNSFILCSLLGMVRFERIKQNSNFVSPTDAIGALYLTVGLAWLDLDCKSIGLSCIVQVDIRQNVATDHRTLTLCPSDAMSSALVSFGELLWVTACLKLKLQPVAFLVWSSQGRHARLPFQDKWQDTQDTARTSRRIYSTINFLTLICVLG